MSILLGDICNVTTGQSAPQDNTAFTEQGIPFIRAGSLEGLLSGKREDEYELINDENAKKFRLKLFPENTVVFAKSGMSAKIGRVYRLKKPCYIVSHLAAVTPSEKVDPGYLHRWFEKNPPSRLIDNDAYPSIKTSVIHQIEIPLPPLAEQKRIAAILDKADAIRRKRQAAIKLADDFLRATFLDMFGDPVTNPKGWEGGRLDEVADIHSGITKGRKLNGNETVNVPYMRVANVQDGHINLTEIKKIEATHAEIKRYLLIKGDILLTEGGDPDKLGRGAVWQGEISPCIHQNHIFRVRPNAASLLPEYLSALISSARGKKYFLIAAKQTTGIASINKTQLSSFPALLPPIGLQQKFAKVVQKQRALQIKLEAIYELQNICVNSLTQRAFRGEL